MKTCTKCGETKSLDLFSSHKGRKHNKHSHCKKCRSIDSHKQFENKNFAAAEKKRHKKFRKNNSTAKSLAEYRAKNKLRTQAHRIVERQVKQGLLRSEPCEKCNEEKTQAHHDDYSKPLDVRWLCHKCHQEHHRELRNQHR